MRKPKSSGSNSTEKPGSDFSWPPSDEELASSGIDSPQTVHDRLRAYFNWPADDESPAAGNETAASTSGEPESRVNWPSPDEGVAPSTAQTSFEPWPAVIELLPDDPPATQPIEVVHSNVGDAAATAIAGADGEPEAEEIITGPWEVEIARLQALIDGLTEKLEWRAKGDTATERRLKH